MIGKAPTPFPFATGESKRRRRGQLNARMDKSHSSLQYYVPKGQGKTNAS